MKLFIMRLFCPYTLLLLLCYCPSAHSSDSSTEKALQYPDSAISGDILLPVTGDIGDMLELAKPSDLAVDYKYPLPKRVWLEPYKLAQCFNLEMATSEFHPDYSIKPHKCALGYMITGKLEVPTILDYLAGQDRQCDWATGHELELRNWVEDQPDNSVTPLSMFKRSYELNRGNVFAAILTAHQMLRPMARFMYDDRYFISSFYPYIGRRESENIANKLIDFRGDLKERGHGHRGDQMGNWYRIWGTMLYQYYMIGHRGPKECYGFFDNIKNGFYQTAVTLSTLAMAFGDEVIFKSNDPDKLKFTTDARGAELINYLNYPVSSKTTKVKCDNRFYLEKAK